MAFSASHSEGDDLSIYRGLAEMSGQELCCRMISSRRPDTGKGPRCTLANRPEFTLRTQDQKRSQTGYMVLQDVKDKTGDQRQKTIPNHDSTGFRLNDRTDVLPFAPSVV